MSSLASRPSRVSTTRGRGGITKRGRPGPTRVDKDGDALMVPASGTSGAGRRSGPGSTRPSQPSSRGAPRPAVRARGGSTRLAQELARHVGGDAKTTALAKSTRSMANTTTLKVHGLQSSKAASNPDGGIKSLLEFLERKATPMKGIGHIAIKKSLVQGNITYILLSNEDAEHVIKVNGFGFAGATLAIAKEEAGWPEKERTEGSRLSSDAKDRKGKLKAVLNGRYNKEQKFLDLSSLGLDPVLKEMEIFSGKSRAEKAFRVLMVILEEVFPTAAAKREAIESITLAGNTLNNVSLVYELADTFPDLKNLDLSNNDFASARSLNRWRGHLKRLEKLLLNGNPIVEKEPGFDKQLTEWFPHLYMLNNVQVRDPQQIAAAEAASIPKTIPQYGADFNDPTGLGEQFVKELLTLYDSNRTKLLTSFYDEQSTFTLSVATHLPKDNDLQVSPWTAYLKHSRNQAKITTASARTQRFMVGEQIQKLWNELPATRHPQLENNLDKYILDSHPIMGVSDPTNQNDPNVLGLHLTIHGEFEEPNPNGTVGKRSFTRSFVLGPGQPGRSLIRVNSDMLCLRAWSALPPVMGNAAAAPMPTAQAAMPTPNVKAPVVPAAPATPAAMTEEQRQQLMIAEVAKRSGMTPDYAKMCLETAQWNFERALAIFEEMKASLPKEAFS